MDKWEDYPIKVLDMAPLIMVTLPTVSSFSSTCGCFLRVERSFSRTISLLFALAYGWPLRRMALCLANGSASSNLRSKDIQVQEKGGRTDPRNGPGRPSSVAPSLPWVLMYLCTFPLHLHHFDDVILASKMEVLLAWSPVFYASILGDVPL
jgi:hypothetical protein